MEKSVKKAQITKNKIKYAEQICQNININFTLKVVTEFQFFDN